jgi:CRISPR/Cas system-associated exonuclease Cas4 (RecB family)
MAKVPAPIHSTVARIYQAYENDADNNNRPHLGASLIGHACERYLWLTFRWADKKKFPGRMLRLFETGQLEEARFTANLRRIGVQIHETSPDGKQWRVSTLGGHFGGSMDGAGLGFPEAPKSWHVIEMKTHNDKSFNELVKNGVQKSKPQHWAQVQTYMGLTGMDRAFYLAVNKNTDELYSERVEYDPVEFAKIKARAERVISAAEPPLRVSNDPSWYVCKMCDFHEQCHGNKVPKANCRTCAHSTPEMDGDEGRWSCAWFKHDIGYIAQLESEKCSSHRYIPILLEKAGPVKDVKDCDVHYEGGLVNGASGLSSVEISRLEDLAIAGEATRLKVQFKDFGAEVVK